MKVSGVPKLFRLADLEKADRRFRREWWPLKSYGGDWVTNGHFFARCIPDRDRVIPRDDAAVAAWAGGLDSKRRVPVAFVGDDFDENRPWTIWECRRSIATVLFEPYAALLDGLKPVRLIDGGYITGVGSPGRGAESMYPIAGIDDTGKVAIVIMPRWP